MPVQWHIYFPGSRKYLGVLDSRFVVDDVPVYEGVAFDNVQGVAVEIACPIEPRALVLTSYVNYQRVPFPMSYRLPHPRVDWGRARILQEDITIRTGVFVGHPHGVSILENLKRIGHIGSPWEAWKIALDL